MSACDKPGLMPVEQALARLLDAAVPTSHTVTIPLREALGRVLAEDILAPLDVPPADNSAMDGYCLRSADFVDGKILPISQRIPAGVAPQPLQPGTAARIFTGAEVPQGADTVVMQEDCVATADGVQINEMPEPGQNIRPQGQDIARGQRALARGQRLRAQELGLLASLGIAYINVFRPLRVAVLSTGDELVEPGDSVAPGQIYNSNRYTLMGLLQGLGLDIVDLGRVADNQAATETALRTAADQADVIISSGGVSVGEEDHVKAALSALGDLQMWKLAIKPGKPFTFGQVLGKPFLGLPGNPAAVFVTFTILCRPWLLKTQGATQISPQGFNVPAGFTVRKAGGRQEYLRSRLITENGALRVEPYPNQSSGVLLSASWGNGFAVVPVGQTVNPGDPVLYLPFDALLN